MALTLSDKKLSGIRLGIGCSTRVIAGMDVLDVMESQHRHGPRCGQRQVGTDQGPAVAVLRIFAVLQQSSVVIPEDDLRRIRCLSSTHSKQ